MSERKPMVLVLAGPNGSGKSTITQFFDIVGNYLNCKNNPAVSTIQFQTLQRVRTSVIIEIF